MILVQIETNEVKGLLDTVDNSKFKDELTILKKALPNKSNVWFVLLDHLDSKQPLAFVAVDENQKIDNAPYLSELARVSDVKGVGFECINQLIENYYSKFWLQAMPLGDGESIPYQNNEDLCNKFYRKIPQLKEYKVKNSIWNGIDASFFYTKNCNNKIMEEELQKQKSNSSTI